VDPRIDNLMADLDATFEAAAARAEDEAASDLAFSLAQEICWFDSLRRGGAASVALGEGRTAAVEAIGRDYVMAGDRGGLMIIPAAHAVVLRRQGPPRRDRDADGPPRRDRDADGPPRDGTTAEPAPPAGEDNLVALLRRLARTGCGVEVTTASGAFRGRLLRAGGDHLAVAGHGGEVVVGMGAVVRIRVDRGG